MTAPEPLGGPARLGVFGGTFDPPHVGHVVVAATARWALGLDRVLLVVANDPWQKSGDRAVTPATDRLALVEAAVEGVGAVEASDLELRRGGPSYTADTLRELGDAHPGAKLFLILGADAAAGLPTWERAEEVRRACTAVLVDRPGTPAGELPSGWDFTRLEIPRLDVTSTDLRARVAAGMPIDGLVPPGVCSVIAARGLYGDARP